MITVTEHDALTGATIVREMNPSEVMSRNQELNSLPAKSLHEIQESNKKLKASAQAKLAALGLTEAEVAALLG